MVKNWRTTSRTSLAALAFLAALGPGAAGGQEKAVHNSPVTRVAVSPNGRLMASLDRDGSIKVSAGRASFSLAADDILSIAWTPDSAQLVGGGAGGKVAVWDVPRAMKDALPPSKVITLSNFGDVTDLTAFARGGKNLVAAGNKKLFAVIDLASGAEQRRFAAGETLGPVVASADGKILAAAGPGKNLRLWNTATGANLGELTGFSGGVSSLSISPDMKTLAVASGDNALSVFDLATGQRRWQRPPAGAPEAWKGLAFDKKTGDLTALRDDGTLAWFDRATGAATGKAKLKAPALALGPDQVITATPSDPNKPKGAMSVTATPIAPAEKVDEGKKKDDKDLEVITYFGTNRQPRTGVEGTFWLHLRRFFTSPNGLTFCGAVAAALLAGWGLAWCWRFLSAAAADPAGTLPARLPRWVMLAIALSVLLSVSATLTFVYLGWPSLLMLTALLALFLGLATWTYHRRPAVRRGATLAVAFVVVLAAAVWDSYARSRGDHQEAETRFTADPQGALLLGTCKVTIPRDHVRGQVERPELALGILVELLDPKQHFAVKDVKILVQEKDFADQLKGKIGASKRGEAFVFVHGYNTTFEAAAMRTAQMARDLDFDGAPVFYSWPSQGTELGYFWDSSAAEESVPYLQQFLALVARQSGAKRIYLLAHSMGNRTLAGALVGLGDELKRDKLNTLFREVVLAAPDVNVRTFEKQLAPPLLQAYPRVTLYANSGDRALALSRRFNNAPRLGDSAEGIFVMRKLDSIDVSNLDTDFDGHGYFGTNHLVLTDLRRLWGDGALPADRYPLRPDTRNGLPYYIFPR